MILSQAEASTYVAARALCKASGIEMNVSSIRRAGQVIYIRHHEEDGAFVHTEWMHHYEKYSTMADFAAGYQVGG